jgi:hypothetical protein
MRLRYTLTLALLLHVVTKSVYALITTIYQFDKSFTERRKIRSRHVTIFDFILNILIGMEALTSEVLFHLWE